MPRGSSSLRGFPVAPAAEWMTLGVCSPEHEPRHDPAIWFPNDGRGVDYAKRLCETCPVQVECLEYALAHRVDSGVWGGESERSRRQLRKALDDG